MSEAATLLVPVGLCLWILFLGGDDKLENTFLGYLEFGAAGEKAWSIRMLAWISLVATIGLFLFDVFS